ncbi:hypothetical protein [Nannocystis pusilla]|uniref:hypothetical protein n=1 Tax=Nannocystis pusilla TaxID=889268 RepID=UPI003B8179E8
MAQERGHGDEHQRPRHERAQADSQQKTSALLLARRGRPNCRAGPGTVALRWSADIRVARVRLGFLASADVSVASAAFVAGAIGADAGGGAFEAAEPALGAVASDFAVPGGALGPAAACFFAVTGVVSPTSSNEVTYT